jgi:hypothetical protein
MKNASIFSTALLLFFAFFTLQTAQAQWLQNATSIYQKDLNLKVGIGVNDPYLQLDVKGELGIRSTIGNSLAGTFREDADGNLSITSYFSPFIGSTSKHILLNPPATFFGRPGNVGVGTNSPIEAKFVVKSTPNNTVAMFGQGTPGISLANAWSSVGFNAYVGRVDGVPGWKNMSDGYSAIMECDPTSGRVQLVQNGYATKDESPTRITPLKLEPNGDMIVGDAVFSAGKLTVNNPDFYKSTLSLEGIDPYMLFRQSGYEKEIAFMHAWSENSNLNGFGGRQGLEFGTPPGDGALMFSTNYAQRMTIEADGRVFIGQGRPASNEFRLSVGGKIMCEELKVQLHDYWPDYVFAADYKLKPLEEVEQHIQAEKHLPGIPAAAEVEKNGLEVGDMQKKMMEKIEELTLYVIDLNKENKALKQRVEQLENKQ